MTRKIQVRRDTSANWITSNTTLDSGEFGFETDTGKFKIGNGLSNWSLLTHPIVEVDLSQYATELYAQSASAAAVSYLTESSQEILDTLNALSTALGEDANFATTVTDSLSEKLSIVSASNTYQTIVENVSNSEIGYLNGVTSSIQAQLDDKASLGSSVFSQTVTAPMLRLTSTIDTLDNTGNFGFQIGQSVSENLRIDNNEILALNNDVKSTLNIQKNGGQVLISGSVVDGSSVGLEIGGPIRLKSSRNAANNTRGIDSMSAKIGVSSTNNRQELQIYSGGDAYLTGSRGSGIQMYGTDDSQHASNLVILTGPPDEGNARIIASGGTGTTGYLSGTTTYTRTNTDTRVTIGNSMWDWVDEKNDTGLLNLKDPSNRPAIYSTSSGATDGTSYGTIAVETGQNFGVGHWSGSSYTNRLSIISNGNVGIGTTNPSSKLQVVGSFAATTKSFVIPHPTKPEKQLAYGSLEGPEYGIYFRGRSQSSVIELPEYWTGLVDENSITVNLTPIGESATPRVKDIANNEILVFSKEEGELDYYYIVFAERKDVEKLIVEF
jgi:hypothetical protein